MGFLYIYRLTNKILVCGAIFIDYFSNNHGRVPVVQSF